MLTAILLSLLPFADPKAAQAAVDLRQRVLVAQADAQVPPAEKAAPAPKKAKPAPAKKAEPKKDAKAAPLKPSPEAKAAAQAKPAEPKPAAEAPMDPEVKKLVDAMQAFYEKTADFEAHFDQTYTYATFKRVQKSSGTMAFKKPALMRWDYEKPSPKTIVVAGAAVYMYDPDAQLLTKMPFKLDKLSASVSFLLGRGKLADEFNIKKSSHKDLKDGVVLELVPKKPDPRFDRVFFLVDPKTSMVTESIVVDPDGSENHMAFSQPKRDQGFGPERFHFEPPPGTQVNDMTQGASP